jgi:hypothetical protein
VGKKTGRTILLEPTDFRRNALGRGAPQIKEEIYMTESILIQEALTFPCCVLSVIGRHAGESVECIFDRKAKDIQDFGRTFWLVRSHRARPDCVQRLCGNGPCHVFFISPATKGGARPTVVEERALEFSEDNRSWHPLPEGLGPVTGKIGPAAYALVFDSLAVSRGADLDMWDFADFVDPHTPVRPRLGCSTVCAVRKDMSRHPERVKSRFRGIVAVARLVKPYCVWLR